MNQLFVLAIAGVFSASTIATPLVTISCEVPKGFHMQYGTYPSERVQTELKNLPEPRPYSSGPVPDGYTFMPTFVIDSDRRHATVVWSETLSDAALRERSKQLYIPYCCSPPSATRARVVAFSPDHIAAIEVNRQGEVSLYSFFPNLGTALLSIHHHEPSGKSTKQLSFSSACQFSWSVAK